MSHAFVPHCIWKRFGTSLFLQLADGAGLYAWKSPEIEIHLANNEQALEHSAHDHRSGDKISTGFVIFSVLVVCGKLSEQANLSISIFSL